jgi:hypothetical protein
MVLAVIVIVLLVACLVGAGVLLAQTRNELVTAQDRIAQLETEQAGTVRELEAEQERREARERDLGERDVQLDDTRRDLDVALQRADTAEVALRDAQARVDAAQAESASAAEALEAARAELAAATEALEAAASSSENGDAHALWALELTRSERRWQLSVAPGIDVPSPFDDADDPLRLAVEVEASALREEVGTQIDVAWDLDHDLPDEASLLVLRLAQELLADAAARAETLELRVGGEDDGVTVELRALDEEGVEVPVLLPELTSGRVRPGESGAWVVSRS